MVSIRLLNKIKSNSFIISSAVHLLRWSISSEYRSHNSFLHANPRFFMRHGHLSAWIFYPFLIPIVSAIKSKKYFISINNIAAIGHLYPEVDYLHRILFTEQSFKGFKIILVFPKSDLVCGSKRVFEQDHFVVVVNGFAHFFLTLAAIKNPEISISAAQSGLDFIAGKSLSSKDVFCGRHIDRIKIIKNTLNFYPLQTLGLGWEDYSILENLGIDRPFFLIQIKDKAINSTFKAVDPSTYVEFIKYVTEIGYQVVFAGREKMPALFDEFGVINYSESPHASPLNDYLLVYRADFLVCSASGFSLIGELLDKPILVLNCWQGVGYPGRRTLCIPSLLAVDGELLRYCDQERFCYECDDLDEFNLPRKRDNITVTDADGLDILAGVHELMTLSSPQVPEYTSLQKMVKDLGSEHSVRKVGLSRISHAFLERYRGLFLQ